jgi:hypothetical protein
MEFGGGCVRVVTIYRKKISPKCWLLLRFHLQLHLGSDQAWSSIEASTLSKNLDQFLVIHKLWFLIELESHLWRIFLCIVVGQLIFQLKVSQFCWESLAWLHILLTRRNQFKIKTPILCSFKGSWFSKPRFPVAVSGCGGCGYQICRLHSDLCHLCHKPQSFKVFQHVTEQPFPSYY